MSPYLIYQKKLGLGSNPVVTGSYDVANAIFDNKSVSTIDTQPTSFALKSDDAVLYYGGSLNDRVYQANMSVASDISTASYSGANKNITTEAALPHGIKFSSDGTKMFIFDSDTDSVYSYTLSPAWSVSTASYDSVSFSVNAQEPSLLGGNFSPDGTKMYVFGGNNTLYQYDLSTPFDISTAVYNSGSFNLATFFVNPTGIAFNGDGTRMFVVAAGTGNIYKFTVTSYDITTSVYNGIEYVVTEDTTLREISFNSTGTKMYIMGDDNDTIYQYSV